MDKNFVTLSTEIAEMKIIVLGTGGFALYPARDETEEERAEMLHRHAHYEFFFSCEDEIRITTQEGERAFCKKVVIVPPSLIHCCSGSGKGCYCMTVKGEPHARFFDAFSVNEITVIDLTEDMSFCLNKLVSVDLNTGLGRAMAETAIKMLFLEMGERTMTVEDSKVQAGETMLDYVDQIETFVNYNYNNDKVNVKMLSDSLFLSQKQASRIIKREYGCTFPELINQKRMSVAAMLLKNTHLSVGEIIERLNINSENYFYKLFKQFYGITPLQYRNKSNIKARNL